MDLTCCVCGAPADLRVQYRIEPVSEAGAYVMQTTPMPEPGAVGYCVACCNESSSGDDDE